jgi:hypothetical protein
LSEPLTPEQAKQWYAELQKAKRRERKSWDPLMAELFAREAKPESFLQFFDQLVVPMDNYRYLPSVQRRNALTRQVIAAMGKNDGYDWMFLRGMVKATLLTISPRKQMEYAKKIHYLFRAWKEYGRRKKEAADGN